MIRFVSKTRLSILVVAVTLIGIGLLSLYLPLQRELEQAVLYNWIRLAESQARTFDGFLMRSQEAAASLSSRTVIRNRIEDFQQEKITWQELQGFTAHRYKDGVNALDNVLSATRVVEGNILVQTHAQESALDPLAPSLLIPDSLQSNKPSIRFFRSGDQVFLLVYSPISGSSELLGWDVLVYPITLQLETEGEKRLMAWLTDETEADRLLATTENLETKGDYSVRESDETLLFLTSLDDPDWTLVVETARSDVYGPVERTLRVALSSFLLAIVGLFLVINYISVHSAKKLLEEVKESRELYKQYAFSDPLTGAHTRFFLDRWLEKNPGKIDEGAFCLVVMDVDDFKTINDKRGHIFGDRVLLHVVDSIQKMMDAEDLVIRYGGDEFLLILDGKSAKAADKLMAAAEEDLNTKELMNEPILLSYGVEIIRSTEYFQRDLNQADSRMYRMKQNRKAKKLCLETGLDG